MPALCSLPMAERSANPGFPRTVWAVGLVSLLTDVGGEMVFPLLPRFLGSMTAAGAAAVGVVEGVADAVSQLVRPWVGARSDARGRRKPFMLLGYGLSSAARPLLAVAHGVFGVGLLRCADRLGKGIRSSPRDALIASSVESSRLARAFSLHRAMDHAGAVLGPMLATALLAAGLSVRQVFAATLVPGALAWLAIVLFVREPDALPRPPPVEPSADGAAEPDPADPAAPLPESLRAFVKVLFLFALGSSTDALLLLRASEMGLGSTAVAGAWTLLHVVKVAASVPGGALADRIGPVRAVGLGWLVYAVVYAGFAVGGGGFAPWALFGVYGLYYALTEGAEKAVVARLVPRGVRGRALGTMSFALGAGNLIASAGAGWLYAQAGPEVAFGSGALLALSAMVALVWWSARYRL